MLEEIYDIDESLTEDDYYDALYYLLGDAYPNLSEDELEDLLEKMLDQLPDQHAESILNTVGTIGKQIGSGALKFAAKNPDLVKGALTVAGTAIGGPIGAKIGGGVGNYLTKGAQNKMMPETGKMLSLMQNPQAQAAMALGSMGVGNGVAPLAVNKNTAPIPTALYLRAMISVAQSALKELDNNNVVPAAEYYESLPFSEDVDRQAEWLTEQLLELSDRDKFSSTVKIDKREIVQFVGCAIQFPLVEKLWDSEIITDRNLIGLIKNLENFIIRNTSSFRLSNGLPYVIIKAYSQNRINAVLTVFTQLTPRQFLVGYEHYDNYGNTRVGIQYFLDPDTLNKRQHKQYKQILWDFENFKWH
jgi:hypothetical protein